MLLLLSADISKINFFEKFFREDYQSVKQLDPDHSRHFVRPDLNTNCLQMLLADDKSSC